MLQPKRTKYRRPQKGRCKGNAQRGNQLAFGTFGIKSLETHWITGRQIEAARIAVTRYMQREGQIWIRIFPDKPVTKKPADVRMGKGKGRPRGICIPYYSGTYYFLRWKVSLMRLQRRLCVLLRRNFRLQLSLLLDVITIKTLDYEDCRN